MTVSRSGFGLAAFLAGLLLIGGCGGGDEPGGGGPGAGAPLAPGIKQIMVKLAKGPRSLTAVIDNELNQDPPPWETIQGQTKEYAKSASELGTYEPRKGTKESWTNLSAAFAKSASELDQAAVAKNKDAARSAHDQIKSSCNACHQQHRGGGGGPPGGPGGGPPGGPGGGPPGGPGGPPPDRPR